MLNKLIELINEVIEVDTWDNGEFIDYKVNTEEIAKYITDNIFPCKPGDTVWLTWWWDVGPLDTPISRKLQYISWDGKDTQLHFKDGAIFMSGIGNVVFTSIEDAKQSIANRKPLVDLLWKEIKK